MGLPALLARAKRSGKPPGGALWLGWLLGCLVSKLAKIVVLNSINSWLVNGCCLLFIDGCGASLVGYKAIEAVVTVISNNRIQLTQESEKKSHHAVSRSQKMVRNQTSKTLEMKKAVPCHRSEKSVGFRNGHKLPSLP